MQKKQEFIAQIMSSKSPVRSCEDVDETALSYAEIKALCAGNPLIAEKMNLDVEAAKLRMLKADHQSQHYRLEDELLRGYPEKIIFFKERIAGMEKDIILYNSQSEKLTAVQESMTGGAASASLKFPGMTVNGVEYKDKEPAAKALLETCKKVKDRTETPVGEYMGFKMSIQFEATSVYQFKLHLRGNMTYQLDLGTDAFGNITRINNTLADLPKRLESAQSQLDGILSQQEAAKQELEKPFAQESELAEKEARLALLNADLNIDGDGGFDVMNDTDSRTENAVEIDAETDSEYESDYEPQTVSEKSTKPSILERIENFDGGKYNSVSGRKSSERDIS
ncbi:MAG: helicase [Oscillospiraceae bacterium]|nr:helicase [Oscillospiraceae bacterium]